jgi:anti-sigma regulatory factor (Ser/Thr protein kinase)
MPEREPCLQPCARTESEDWDWFLRIPNRLELTKAIRDLVAASCEMHGVDEDTSQELKLVISEIVNNSIEHVKGRGPDGYHEVDVWFRIRDGLITARIFDEGEGGVGQTDFDEAGRPSFDSDRGRGLLLIKEYVDDIRVRHHPRVGTEVRIEKRFGTGKEEGA